MWLQGWHALINRIFHLIQGSKINRICQRENGLFTNYLSFISLLKISIFSLQALQVEQMNVDPLAKRNASYSSCYDVWKYISELGISKVNFIEKLCSPFEGVTQEPVIFTTWSNSCYSLKSLGILENQQVKGLLYPCHVLA